MRFDALLLLSFGGPERAEDVMPFLRRVVEGRGVPDSRLEIVAQHYMLLGGRSPINDQNRALIEALREELLRRGRDVPVYWGNRNWHPLLADAVASMRDDGVGRAAVFATSAYSSYSGCRQYLEDIRRAREAVGAGAPELVKIRPFFDEAGFVGPLARGLADAVAAARRSGGEPAVLMSAHSIPASMADVCDYEGQLRRTADAVAAAAGLPASSWSLVFQSRSGPPGQPWLEPDVGEAIAALPPSVRSVVVAPIGFVSDHMEVVYDLDVVAAGVARERGMEFHRSPTPGTAEPFVRMICDLFDGLERDAGPERWDGLERAAGPEAAESGSTPWRSAPSTGRLCGPGCCTTGRPGGVAR